jgi:hypothetical protein
MSSYTFKQFLTESPDYLTEYSETLYEIVENITLAKNSDNPPQGLIKAHETGGTGYLWSYAQEWAIEFCLLHENTEWDGEYFDEIESFVNAKIEALI